MGHHLAPVIPWGLLALVLWVMKKKAPVTRVGSRLVTLEAELSHKHSCRLGFSRRQPQLRTTDAVHRSSLPPVLAASLVDTPTW